MLRSIFHRRLISNSINPSSNSNFTTPPSSFHPIIRYFSNSPVLPLDQNQDETYRDPDAPPRLFVVQPRIRPEIHLKANLEEALNLASSLEQQRDDLSHISAPAKKMPPHVIVQNPAVKSPRTDTYFGMGTVETIKCHLDNLEAKEEVDAVFVNATLRGIQQRNLEMAWGKPVVDRVGLIIEIFNAHAQTKEAKLQAELAALMCKRSRLVRVRGPDGRHTFGGETEVVSAKGRGSGGRGFISGAGETEIQLQRRRILDRRQRLLSEIAEVRRTRATQRAWRKRQERFDPSYNLDTWINHGTEFSLQTYDQKCTFEPSTSTPTNPFYNSPSTLSFLSNESSGNSLSDNDMYNSNNPPLVIQPSLLAMEIVSRRDLLEMLVACAKAISENDCVNCDFLMSEVQSMVSVSGEPLQRLGAYMLEGLVARLASSGSSIYKALHCKEPTSPELLSYMHLLYESCPYFKFSYLSANGAIAEAMKNESKIHIIDFQINQGTQWITLIQALATRPGGPPQVRLTGIDDSFSAYARRGGLEIVGKRLANLARSCGVPFEFHPIAISGCEIETKHLEIGNGEALAVNFAMMLHHMPDEGVGGQNHRDRLLRMVKSLSPKVVTLVEQESNTNTAPFMPRFTETLEYYLAIFESIDVAFSRNHKERINVEQHCLARDIVNIVACEGLERAERHEPLGKWKLRFAMAGFKQYPLSSYVNATIKTLLENYSKNYRLEERDGCLYLGWMDRDLVASCAWV